MKRNHLIIGAVVTYLLLLATVIYAVVGVSNEELRLQIFYVDSYALMFLTVVFAVLIMKVDKDQESREHFERYLEEKARRENEKKE